MAEKEVFQHGGVTYPLAGDTTFTSLRDADPSIYYALEFYCYVLGKYVGERIVFEAQRAGINQISSAVGATVPWDPQEYLETAQFKFPLLAMYRKSTKIGDRTIGYRHDESSLGLAYVFPPLTGGQVDGMLPLLNAVKGVIDHSTELGWDPTFTPSSGIVGDQPWAFAGLESIEVQEASWGGMAGTGTLVFPAIVFSLMVKERASIGDVPGAYSFITGSDLNITFQPNTGAYGGVNEGPAIENLASDLVNLDFELTSLLPVTGPLVGGTTVTLTGKSFDAGCEVYFGGQLADSIVVASATTITCQTPALDALPTSVDVTVTNRRDQSDTLSGAFTYV